MKQLNLRMNIEEYILLFKIIHAWIFVDHQAPMCLNRSIQPVHMDNATVMLVSVLYLAS